MNTEPKPEAPKFDALEIIRQRGRGGADLAALIDQMCKSLDENKHLRVRAAYFSILYKDGPNSTDLGAAIGMMGTIQHMEALLGEIKFRLFAARQAQNEEGKSKETIEEIQRILRGAKCHDYPAGTVITGDDVTIHASGGIDISQMPAAGPTGAPKPE